MSSADGTARTSAALQPFQDCPTHPLLAPAPVLPPQAPPSPHLQLDVEVAEALLVVLLHARHAVALRQQRVLEVADLPVRGGREAGRGMKAGVCEREGQHGAARRSGEPGQSLGRAPAAGGGRRSVAQPGRRTPPGRQRLGVSVRELNGRCKQQETTIIHRRRRDTKRPAEPGPQEIQIWSRRSYSPRARRIERKVVGSTPTESPQLIPGSVAQWIERPPPIVFCFLLLRPRVARPTLTNGAEFLACPPPPAPPAPPPRGLAAQPFTPGGQSLTATHCPPQAPSPHTPAQHPAPVLAHGQNMGEERTSPPPPVVSW